MTEKTRSQFVSLRWRLLLPVFTVILTLVVSGAYVLALQVPSGQTEAAQQLTALVTATLSASVIVALFVGVMVLIRRLNRIQHVAMSLADGHRTARTRMQPLDEVGKLGHALDRYADYAQEKQDDIRLELRRKRREITHLLSVLEAMPDGVIVQDLDGRVIMMNDLAREHLGSRRVYRSSGIHELTALVTDQLGAVLAPGLYAIGDPRHVDLDGKMIQAQAAAVMSSLHNRVGTVILLRDITDQVRQERGRDALIERLSTNVQQPLAQMARNAGQYGYVTELMLADFVRSLTRHAVELQKIIGEFREIGEIDKQIIERTQSPLLLETLVWAVINEWRQVAQANKLAMHVTIERKGLFVLGDERRLRWAIGNIVDNAIKYTPQGGALTLEIKGEANDMALLRVRDNGVGIALDDLPHIFTRFYRGTPTTAAGEVLQVPGMGQGLYITRQIIEAHGGSIRVKSKPLTGTAVYFSLPLTAAEGFELPALAEDIDGETVIIRDRPSHHDLSVNQDAWMEDI